VELFLVLLQNKLVRGNGKIIKSAFEVFVVRLGCSLWFDSVLLTIVHAWGVDGLVGLCFSPSSLDRLEIALCTDNGLWTLRVSLSAREWVVLGTVELLVGGIGAALYVIRSLPNCGQLEWNGLLCCR